MHLKSVEIFGFKSFPQKISLGFEPGITCIVGPNGCGKSNVLDAIIWALGEQSPKSLRGSKMEDIIFNGTDKYPPLHYAEVILNFANEDKALKIDFNEVSISRKLYRSGESEYSLNRSPVRLKDIQELLMSVGLGEGSYSFILQGTVESFVTSKPEEKRTIFDEAAGILQYKEKKRETLRKLEETDNNLLRIEDIIKEVERQINSLDRQVKKAQRYREIHEELKTVEQNIARAKLYALHIESNQNTEKISLLDQQEAECLSSIKTQQDELDTLKNSYTQALDEKEKKHETLISAQSQINNFLHTIEINKQRTQEFLERISNLEENKHSRLTQIEEQKSRITRLEQEIVNATETAKINTQQIARNNEEISTRNIEIKTCHKLISETKNDLLVAEEKKTETSNELIDIQGRFHTQSARKKRLTLEHLKITDELQTHKNTLAETTRLIEEKTHQMGTYKNSLQELTSALRNDQETLEQIHLQKNSLEKEIEILTSQVEFLKDLKMRYEHFLDSKEIEIILDTQLSPEAVVIARVEKTPIMEERNGKQTFRFSVKAKILTHQATQIEEKIASLKSDLNTSIEQIANFESKIQSTKDRLKALEDKAQETDKDLARIVESARNTELQIQKIEEELAIVILDIQETESEIKTLTDQEATLKATLETRKAQIEEKQKTIQTSEQVIRNNSDTINNLEIEITRLNTQIESLTEEKRAKEENIALFKQDLEKIILSLNDIESEQTTIQEKIKLIELEEQKLTSTIQSATDTIATLKEALSVFERREKEITARVENLTEKLTESTAFVEKTRGETYAIRLKLKDLEFAQTQICDFLKQTYAIAIDSIPESAPSGIEDLPFAEQTRDELKKKEQSLGTVNLVAIDEFEELKKRFDFLETQKNDLIESKETLKRAIAKINKTSREVFLEVFQKIQEEFKENFRFLFGGGQAKILLLDEENILDSGIEIIVQPPGKKLQSLSLLSGGEKTLTAIALVFAIFKIKPSSLCILDEIDAALDESNVDRFNHMLSEFAKHAQFLLVTHNKKTISKASILYGVTMQESGVSKVVSVKLLESFEKEISQPVS